MIREFKAARELREYRTPGFGIKLYHYTYKDSPDSYNVELLTSVDDNCIKEVVCEDFQHANEVFNNFLIRVDALMWA